LQECYFFSRANNKTISRLVRSCYEKGHLRKEGRRYFPEGSFFLCMYTDVEPEPEVTCGVVLCKSAKCQRANAREFCRRHVCPICGPSHTHYVTREEAEGALERRNYHRDRLAHSPAPSRVRTSPRTTETGACR